MPNARFSLGRDQRLRRRADFLRVQSIGRRLTTRHFVLLVAARPASLTGGTGRGGASKDGARRLPDDSPLPPRLGIVVTRKLGSAVRRNRIKRLCRECFRLWRELLPPQTDIVVIARTGAHLLSLAEVRAEWSLVARRLRDFAVQALAREESEHHLSPGKRP